MAASGLLHALLLGGLVLVLGSATGPPANLRVRLVTEIKAVSEFPAVRQAPSMPPAISEKTSTPGRSRIEAPPAEPSGSTKVSPEMARLPIAPASPPLAPTGSGESSAPAGAIGEGAVRSPVPRPGPPRPLAATPLPSAEAESTRAPTPLEATTQGFFLMPGGSGSGTGRAGVGAADRGSGAGDGGAAGGGTRQGGQGLPGKPGGGDGGGGVASRGGGEGAGNADGVAALLRAIRRRIEEAKIYPDAARREGIQGTVELRFRITADGSVEAVEIVRSSGHHTLDEISKQTILRAAPYPTVKGWIRIPLSYRLDE